MNFLVKVSDISKEIKESFPKVSTSVASSYVVNAKINYITIGRNKFVSKVDYFKIKNYYFDKFKKNIEVKDVDVEPLEIKYNKNSKFLNNWNKCKEFADSMKLKFGSCARYEMDYYLNEMEIKPIDLYDIAPKSVRNKLKKLNMV